MARKTVYVKNKNYLSSSIDTFVPEIEEIPVELRKVLTSYKFEKPNIYPDPIEFEKNDPPLVFRTTPESLLNLAITVIEKIPLPMVYTWTTEQVCRWLRRYGYPQYQETFRENFINGRTLLLLDASALSAMNIKDFDHIRRITYGIRCLFNFEMTKFGRSISLAPEYHYELYKLLRVKNGTKYDRTKASDLWRRLQIIRPYSAYKEHWQILERWLKLEHDVVERIGGIHRYELYKCRKIKEVEAEVELKPCRCMPPCECHWTKRNIQMPSKLSMVSDKEREEYQLNENILSILMKVCPERYVDHHEMCEAFFRDNDVY